MEGGGTPMHCWRLAPCHPLSVVTMRRGHDPALPVTVVTCWRRVDGHLFVVTTWYHAQPRPVHAFVAVLWSIIISLACVM